MFRKQERFEAADLHIDILCHPSLRRFLQEVERRLGCAIDADLASGGTNHQWRRILTRESDFQEKKRTKADNLYYRDDRRLEAKPRGNGWTVQVRGFTIIYSYDICLTELGLFGEDVWVLHLLIPSKS